jgi:hypothetical protein
VTLSGPDDNQTHRIIANAPHKHVSFTYNHVADQTILDGDKTHGQLYATLLILVLIGNDLKLFR